MAFLSSKAARANSPDSLHDVDRAVRVTRLAKRFDGSAAVANATFEVAHGTLMALLGPSGCGKTTTLRLIAGFEVPDSGSIHIAGQAVADGHRFVPPERRRVGMVFQDYALFPHLNVRENVAYGLSYQSDRDRRVKEVLGLVGLEDVQSRMPYELSGGQQQRVALARALAPAPAVVLLDEPFSNLDAALRARVRADVKRILREANASAIFVTHDQEEAFAMADNVGVMLQGVVEQVGTPEEIYLRPASLEIATFLGTSNILNGEAAGDCVTCALGTLPTVDPAHGPVRVAIRPETIRLHPDTEASMQATVVEIEFRGYYKDVRLRLASGETIHAVMGMHIPSPVGESVLVGVNAPVPTFPL